MTRHLIWQLEMQPQMFVEMSQELAKEKGISNGEKVTVKSARGEVWAIAMVTDRFKPFKVGGSTVHQVGIPWHFGWQFPEDGSGGDSANLLTPNVGRRQYHDTRIQGLYGQRGKGIGGENGKH